MTPLSVERYNGWLLLAHPHLEDQFSTWQNQAIHVIQADTEGYRSNFKVKRLATLERLMFERIPSDPTSPQWLLGNSLGAENRAWRRAKFLERYRLFFRFDSAAKVIIYAWVNDESSLRSRGSRDDPSEIFSRKLSSGNPPSSWEELLESIENSPHSSKS